MRIETNVGNPDGESMPMAQIADPVNGFMAMLFPSQTIAARFEFPKQEHGGGIGFSVFRAGALASVPGKKTRKLEDLGEQIIDGIEYQGGRTTITSDEQPSLVVLDEEWTSKELGMIGLRNSSGPEGRSEAKLQKINRSAPDPSLFQIPAGYPIHNMKDGDPDYQLR